MCVCVCMRIVSVCVRVVIVHMYGSVCAYECVLGYTYK